MFVLFAALLLWGCLCLADVDKCLGLACLRRSLRVGAEAAARPPVTLSVNHRKLKVPREIFTPDMRAHLPVYSVLTHFGEKKTQTDLSVHYFAFSLRLASLWFSCWIRLHRTDT